MNKDIVMIYTYILKFGWKVEKFKQYHQGGEFWLHGEIIHYRYGPSESECRFKFNCEAGSLSCYF